MVEKKQSEHLFLLVDDHIIVRKGLQQFIAEAYPGCIIHEAGSAKESLKLASENNYDIIVLDISLPDKNGLEVLKDLQSNLKKTPVLVISVYPEEQYALRVLKAGAMGFLNKDRAPEEMIKAIANILKGKKYITSSIAEHLANLLESKDNKLPHEILSDREYQVMILIAHGKSITSIAEEINLSVNTISTYRTRILDKLKLSNNAEITRYAIEQNLS